jgi:hypothetical protein
MRKNDNEIKKNNGEILRICSFNVHNFVTRCNQGINPLFGENLNIFETPRNIERFIEMFKEINADILCLQNISPILNQKIEEDIINNKEIADINFNYLNKEMEKLGYKYRVIYDMNYGNFTKNESKNYIYNANGIYSKKEIVDTIGYQLFINKNICFIDIKFKNKTITIGNTELLEKEDISNKIKKEDNIIEIQNKTVEEIIKNLNKNNIILCGSFGFNLFQNNNIIKWNEKRMPLINNFNNTMYKSYTTNFNNNDQTDFILINKKAELKSISTFIYNTLISGHNAIISNII